MNDKYVRILIEFSATDSLGLPTTTDYMFHALSQDAIREIFQHCEIQLRYAIASRNGAKPTSIKVVF